MKSPFALIILTFLAMAQFSWAVEFLKVEETKSPIGKSIQLGMDKKLLIKQADDSILEMRILLARTKKNDSEAFEMFEFQWETSKTKNPRSGKELHYLLYSSKEDKDGNFDLTHIGGDDAFTLRGNEIHWSYHKKDAVYFYLKKGTLYAIVPGGK